MFCPESESRAIVHMNYIIQGAGSLVNEKGEETPIRAGDFALVNPDEKHQYQNKGNCGINLWNQGRG
jgi:quercetin dioxygenase-like cupin family protein